MAYKRCLVAKKNLFNINASVSFRHGITIKGKDLICISYASWLGTLHEMCPSLKAGDVITLSTKLKSTTGVAPEFIQIQGQVLYIFPPNAENHITITVTEDGLTKPIYLYNTNYANSSVPTTSVYTDFMVEKGSIATTYVPYGYLPSYKSKLKIANVCQLMDKSTYPSTRTLLGVTFTNNGDGTIIVNGATEEIYASYSIRMPRFKTVTNNHKYVLFSGIENMDVSYVECLLWIGRADSTYFVKDCVETNSPNTFGFIIPQGNYPLYQKVELRIRKGYTANNLVFKLQLFDLTEMYGAGHEPTTVAEFKTKFPNDLYPYAPKCWLTSYKHNLIATTKNLLSYSETTAEFPETEWENTNPRDLSEGVWYVATSANNYTLKATVTDYKIERNLLYINVAQAAYGLSRAFKCNPGEVYTLSVRGEGNIQLGVGFFDMSGNYLSYTNRDASLLSFTTPPNCKWLWVNFAASQHNSKIYFRDIQLEKGNAATSRIPNGYV